MSSQFSRNPANSSSRGLSPMMRLKMLFLGKGFYFSVEDIISADQAKVFHDRLREIADYAAVVRNTCGIQQSGVGDLSGGHILEDNFALLFLAELEISDTLMAKRANVK